MAKSGEVSLRKKELFEAIGYHAHVGQVRVHQSKASRRIVIAGSRWGKSKCASYEVVAAMLTPGEKRRGWIVGPTYQLTEFIFDQVRGVMSEHFPHRVLQHTQRDRTLVIRNLSGGTSMLRAKSADDPSSLLGEALDFVVLDEAASLHADVWEGTISQRLIDRRGWALLISTPRGKNWLHRLWRRGQSGQDPDFQSWQCPTTENTYIDAKLIDAERSRLPPDTFAREYMAEFVGADDAPCTRCGGPSSSVSGWVIVPPEFVIPLCRECESAVDGKGQTVVGIGRDGESKLVVVEEHGVESVPSADELATAVAPNPPALQEPKPSLSHLPLGPRAWPLGGYTTGDDH